MPAAAPSVHLRRAGREVHVRCSTVVDGDFHLDGPPVALAHRRQAFERGPWTQLDEVHGTRVVEVRTPGEHDGAEADAAVTRCTDAVLSVWVGDCAPVALVGDGVTAVAHAGWRGALDGILPATVAAMGDAPQAVLGPCAHACCYEFGADLLHRFVGRFGAAVAGTTTWGTPSLSMPHVVRASLAEVGVSVTDLSECTVCHPDRWFSHRRGQAQRQVMTVRMMEAR